MNRCCRVRAVAAAVACGAASALVGPAASADTARFDQPASDRWMYPFSFTPGTRTVAPTFGAVGSDGFDDRDGQFLVGFNTAGLVPTGLGAGSYQITSARLTVTDSGGGIVYDNSYDLVSTYLAPATDADAGRPIEVHGVGFRNGYTRLGFGPNDGAPPAYEESSPFGPPGGPAEGVRHAFPLGFDAAGNGIDVSNNVADGFESNPWALGVNSTLTPGSVAPADSTFTFDLNLSDPNVLGYLQDALNDGTLGLMVTSLHPATQQSAEGTPRFYTKENVLHDPGSGFFLAPQLEVQYTIVPEPGTAGLLALAGTALLARRHRRD